jgi:hypothetical protein
MEDNTMSIRHKLPWLALAAAFALPAAAAPPYDPAAPAGCACVSGTAQNRAVWVPGHWEQPYYGEVWYRDRASRYDRDWPYEAYRWNHPETYGWDDRRWETYGGWDGRHRDNLSYNEDARGYLRFDR